MTNTAPAARTHDRATRMTARAALAAVPLIVLLGVVAAVTSPDVVAAQAGDPDVTWRGALPGAAVFAAVLALPQVAFALALLRGTAGPLTATAVAAPLLALITGFVPLGGAIADGWGGVAPVAVLTAAAVGVLDVVVGVVAARAVRRGGDGPP